MKSKEGVLAIYKLFLIYNIIEIKLILIYIKYNKQIKISRYLSQKNSFLYNNHIKTQDKLNGKN